MPKGRGFQFQRHEQGPWQIYKDFSGKDFVDILSVFETFITIIEGKDIYLAGHSRRVGQYSKYIGNEINLKGKDIDIMLYAALLHDIGKMCIPDNVLYKKGNFSASERSLMGYHSFWTYKILKQLHFEEKRYNKIPYIAAFHHEKINGSGYFGVTGSEMHICAKIIAVADMLDALTSKRCYSRYDVDGNPITQLQLGNVMDILYTSARRNLLDEKIVAIVIEKITDIIPAGMPNEPFSLPL